MGILNGSQVVDAFQWRYAVKRFDPTRTIDSATWDSIETSLVLTPSSFGLQPWKFMVVHSPEAKAKLPAISWNQTQPGECSHMVVVAARKSVEPEYVDAFLGRTASMRNVSVESMKGYRGMILSFMGRMNPQQQLEWARNQAYIALGQLLASAAILGIDACPMEGIVAAEYDKLLELEGTGYTTVVGCALGFRHPEDNYALATKVRFEHSEVVVRH